MRSKRPSATDPSHEDNWRGGFYELAIKLGDHSDARLDTAVRTLWRAADLGPPFRRHSTDQPEVSAASVLAGHLHALATIPGLGSTLASVIVVREETHNRGAPRYAADWLDLCLPLGALGNLDARVGAYPFVERGSSSRPWREPLERWFAGIAREVFDVVEFEHAIAGHEVSGIAPDEVRGGRLAQYTPGPDGTLSAAPLTDWQ